ncbi:hypothetical protein KY338_03890 [Candidatus Woesearchaeota archaeon]|nr:hypothetical protein [Candidatus Woesearchaeota archaeon]MBW3005454.1 hypothetical protein [Candidatus Woesearchaeota archaeon]
MAFAIDTVQSLNLVLCVAILALGYWGYKVQKNKMSLFVGIAFGLFGISHLIGILGYGAELESIMVIVRLVGYLIVIFALYKIGIKKK